MLRNLEETLNKSRLRFPKEELQEVILQNFIRLNLIQLLQSRIIFEVGNAFVKICYIKQFKNIHLVIIRYRHKIIVFKLLIYFEIS